MNKILNLLKNLFSETVYVEDYKQLENDFYRYRYSKDEEIELLKYTIENRKKIIKEQQEKIEEFTGALDKHTFIIGTYDDDVFEIEGNYIERGYVYLNGKIVAYFDMKYWYIEDERNK